MNGIEIKKIIVNCGYTVDEIATILEIKRNTLDKKLSNLIKFSVREIYVLKTKLNVSYEKLIEN